MDIFILIYALLKAIDNNVIYIIFNNLIIPHCPHIPSLVPFFPPTSPSPLFIPLCSPSTCYPYRKHEASAHDRHTASVLVHRLLHETRILLQRTRKLAMTRSIDSCIQLNIYIRGHGHLL